MNTQTLKLLHVENDNLEAEIFQRLLDEKFEKGGYELVHVTTMREALEQLCIAKFHTVLLDLDLNDVQGLDNVRAIKEQNPDIPIVVLSGHDDNLMALQAVRGGAQEYMVKGHSNSRMLELAVLSSIERKHYERHLFQLANCDELTALPNRRAFMSYLKQWLVRASRWERQECIMFLDVNNFKDVNDTLGHDIGDLLLKQISAILLTTFRASDMLARYAGDEFIVHLDTPAQQAKEISTRVAEKITEQFHTPLSIGGHTIQTSLSIGIAFFPEHGKDASSLICSADKAMYSAKKNNKSFVFAEAL